MKIGVFDSGVGGMTVLQELLKQPMGAEFIYLGDTAHVPYGIRSSKQVKKLSVQCAQTLKSREVDVLIVACNTASSLAMTEIEEQMGVVPVYGVVGPGIEVALQAKLELAQQEKSNPDAPIVIFATKATVKSHAYGAVLRSILGTTQVIEQACPLLVPLIEEGAMTDPRFASILEQVVRAYVEPHVRTLSPGVALLGCTHYPWIQDVFERLMPGWKVVSSAQALRRAVSHLTHSKPEKKNKVIEWIFTDPDSIPDFAKAQIERIERGEW